MTLFATFSCTLFLVFKQTKTSYECKKGSWELNGEWFKLKLLNSHLRRLKPCDGKEFMIILSQHRNSLQRYLDKKRVCLAYSLEKKRTLTVRQTSLCINMCAVALHPLASQWVTAGPEGEIWRFCNTTNLLLVSSSCRRAEWALCFSAWIFSSPTLWQPKEFG